MSAVESSDFGLGRTARAADLLAGRGVLTEHIQRVINDPLHRARVAAALRGEPILREVNFEDLLAREVTFTSKYFELIEVPYPGDIINEALRRAESAWGGLTEHDRFVPGGIGLSRAFQCFYNFNQKQEASGSPPLKLHHNPKGEWWRSTSEVYRPTEAGVIRCDFSQVMRPTDLQGRPFCCNYDEQLAWAKQQGGDGLTSAEETLYLLARSVFERDFSLWGAGWTRCRNLYYSESSLFVSWDADDGLSIGHWDRGDWGWYIGALARKFVALGS